MVLHRSEKARCVGEYVYGCVAINDLNTMTRSSCPKSGGQRARIARLFLFTGTVHKRDNDGCVVMNSFLASDVSKAIQNFVPITMHKDKKGLFQSVLVYLKST